MKKCCAASAGGDMPVTRDAPWDHGLRGSRDSDASWPSRRTSIWFVLTTRRTITEPSTPEALESFTPIHIPTMRRAQSTRHVTRASVPTIGTNDLGVLKEVPEESKEVALRRQLLEKSKDNDKVWRTFTFVALTPT